MSTFSSERSQRRVHRTTKRILEHSNHEFCNRYLTGYKRTKIEAGNLQTGIKVSGNSKIVSNVVMRASTSKIIELNDSTPEHRMSPIQHEKANLQRQLTKKSVKLIGNHSESKKITARDVFLASARSETSSQSMPHAGSHSISKNRRGVSVSREFPRGSERLDLVPAKSEVLTNRVSQLASSLNGKFKISDKQGFSSSRRKMEKNESTGIAGLSQNKPKQVDRDETCKAAQRRTSSEYRRELIVEEQPQFSSPKWVGLRAENFSEKMWRSEGVSCSFKSKSIPEQTEAQQGIKKSAPITDFAGSGVLQLNVALDAAHSVQSTNFSKICSHECEQDRSRVHKVLQEFKELFTKLVEEWEKKSIGEQKTNSRADLRAASILRKKGKWINRYPHIGDVPGVRIGDRFQYRTELAIVGLHREYMHGIRCEKIDGKIVATSIVDAGRFYPNKTVNADEFIYIGEGGNPEVSSGPKDQKLDGGNLALKNSMDSQIPVRVIRREQTLGESNIIGINRRNGYTFVYDGLFQVTVCNSCQDPITKKKIFKFRMKRMTVDPNLTQQISSVPRTSTTERKQGMTDDMGHRKEKMLTYPAKNVKTSKFIYSRMPNGFGGKRRWYSGFSNKDENFDYKAGVPMAKPLISNRCAYANRANKLKLS